MKWAKPMEKNSNIGIADFGSFLKQTNKKTLVYCSKLKTYQVMEFFPVPVPECNHLKHLFLIICCKSCMFVSCFSKQNKSLDLLKRKQKCF